MNDSLSVTVSVKNTGNIKGQEVRKRKQTT